MIQYLINLFRALFGLDKKPSKELQWLEKKASEQKKKLKEIDESNFNVDEIEDYFNE